MTRKGCRSGTSGVVSGSLEGRSAGARSTWNTAGPRPRGSTWNTAASTSTAHDVPRGTRLHPNPWLMTFHLEHGRILINGSRSFGTRPHPHQRPTTFHVEQDPPRRPRRSTWNTASSSSTVHDLLRGARLHPYERLATFHVEQVAPRRPRRSTWNTAALSSTTREVPRGTRSHPYPSFTAFHVEHGHAESRTPS